MRLEFATNEMVNIFDNDMKFIVLKKAIYEINNPIIKKELAIRIEAFNTFYKVIIDMFRNPHGSFEDSLLKDSKFIYNSFEMYQNAISSIIFTRDIKFNFKKAYKQKYVQMFREDILDFWNESSLKENILCGDRTFIKMFDEIHDYTLKFNEDIFSKKLSSLKELVRGVKESCLENYDRMIPKDEYSGFNRWNPPKRAFLYLGYSENEDYSEVSNSIETCCEELRMKAGEIVTVCKFKNLNKNSRLLDLSIDESIVDIQEEIINDSMNNELDKILNDEKLLEKGKMLREAGEERKLKRLIRSKIRNRSDRKNIERYIGSMFIHDIVESIFLPVEEDKETYLPFHLFANYLIDKGYCGVIHKSTRMDLLKKKGKNVILFNPLDAEPIEGTMKLFTKKDNKIIEVR